MSTCFTVINHVRSTREGNVQTCLILLFRGKDWGGGFWTMSHLAGRWRFRQWSTWQPSPPTKRSGMEGPSVEGPVRKVDLYSPPPWLGLVKSRIRTGTVLSVIKADVKIYYRILNYLGLVTYLVLVTHWGKFPDFQGFIIGGTNQ